MAKRSSIATWESSPSSRKREGDQKALEKEAIIDRVQSIFAELIEMIEKHPDAGAVGQFIDEHQIPALLPIYRKSLQTGDWTPLHEAAKKGPDFVELLLSLPGFLALVNWEYDGGERPIDVVIQRYAPPEEGDEDYLLPSIMALLREGATESPFVHDGEIDVNIKKVFRAHRRFFNMVEAAEPNMEVLTTTLAEYPFLAKCKKGGVPVLEYARQTGAGAEVLALLSR
jgi:hypothetical protein